MILSSIRHTFPLVDNNIALSNDAEAASHNESFKALQSERKEAAMATYGRAFEDKNARDEVVQPHKFQERAICANGRASAEARI